MRSLEERAGKRVKRNPRQSPGAPRHLWDNQKKMRINNGRILWKLRRDKVATKPQREGCRGKKKNGSILPNARQRLSKMEAEIRTRILGLEIRSLLVIFRKTRIG